MTSGLPDNADTAQTRPKPVAPTSLRGRLVAGVLLIIPLAVTAILIRYVYSAALIFGTQVVNWIHLGITWINTGNVQNVTPFIDPKAPGWYYKVMAVALTICLLYMLGWLGTNVVGRRIIEAFEFLLEKIPLVDTVYGAMKRMVHALSGVGKDEKDQRVVLVDFPHEHMKAIAFMTNTLEDLNSGQKMATVYVPTTPNPTSGYMEIVPVDRITLTDWTMEEALSMILSGGATAPPSVRLEPHGKSTPTAPTPVKNTPKSKRNG
ncbi:MAG TPA: DUF502 domain-containing protein [Phycisphaerae bacterium]|nr:DUF502 domain-containing protein [Phycisphaerae bacterium]HRW53945.1 DUF502 domain-containing protein [Phycisphaerae bacterium]